MWTISKQFKVSYAHRVFTQNLFDNDLVPKCRNLHGHDSVLEYYVAADKLNNSMVIDYTLLKPQVFSKFNAIHINDLDHKLLLSTLDPNFNKYKAIYPQLEDINDELKTYIDNQVFVVSFVPTAETMAKFFYNEFSEFTKRVKVQYGINFDNIMVNFKETQDANCYYQEDENE